MNATILVRDGTVVDGTGAPAFSADVAIRGDRIVAVAPALDLPAARIIDAAGKVVTPGFIDIHSHSDFFYSDCPDAESKVRQGVTTEVVGMCSFSPAPCNDGDAALMEGLARTLGATMEVRWESFGEYLEYLEARQAAINVVHFVGHGALRLAAMGPDRRAPRAAELERMRALLREAIQSGAFGFSTGLVYAPSGFAKTAELIALAEVAAREGGMYFTHIRGEAETLLDGIAEAIRIAEEGELPLQIAHLKAAGRENWPRMAEAIELIENAIARGVPVNADVYPYAASSTVMPIMLPAWVHDGGTSKLLERVADGDTRRRIIDTQTRADGRWLTDTGSYGWNEVMIATCPDRSLEGMRLDEVGRLRGGPPAEVMMDLLIEYETEVSIVLFSQAEENVSRVLTSPFVMVGSDSLGLACGPGPHVGKPHPRMYGTFPRVLGHYVRERGLLTLQEAVAKMTGRPARKLGLRDRGRVAEGWIADLTVFDPVTVSDRATFEDPHRYPDGISQVIVNGELTVDDGRWCGVRAGRVLRRH